MRLFTGLDLPAEVVHNLEQLLERLRPTARIHWSLPANLHITTKFIGEWPEERLGELKAPLAALGIAREMRAFSPHLTLARIKEKVPLQPLREAVVGLASLDFGQFQAASFFLYQSTLRPSGSVYTKLAEFPLVKQ